jgi:hydrogenase maturation factor
LLSCFPFGVIVLFYRVSCLVSFYCNPCYTGLLPTLVAPPDLCVADHYQKPLVVAGFELLDILQAVSLRPQSVNGS